MFGSSMLDIAIGIIFVFLLLSVMATAINEIIQSTMGKRGEMLLRGVRALLNDTGAQGLVAQVYTHGQIYGLYEHLFNPEKPSNLPSYIPSRNFALALLDCVEHDPMGAHYADALAKEAEAVRDKAVADLAALKAAGPVAAKAIAAAQRMVQDASDTASQARKSALEKAAAALAARLPAETAAAAKAAAVASALASAVTAATAAGATVTTSSGTGAVQNIVAITQELKVGAQVLAANKATEKVGKPLVAMIAMAGDDAKKLQRAVEDWYNSGMDRVSGWYKYHTQQVLFGIGLTMAIFLNANTIAIVRQLSIDPTLRQALVAAAGKSTKNPAGEKNAAPPSPQPTTSAPASHATASPDKTTTTTTSVPAATTTTTPATAATSAAAPANKTTATTGNTTAPASDSDAGEADVKKQVDDARNAFKDVSDLGIPLGWSRGAPHTLVAACHNWRDYHAYTDVILDGNAWEILIGWILTAIAISLGAPFWFDILNKFMVIRSTVKPQEKSRTEASKD